MNKNILITIGTIILILAIAFVIIFIKSHGPLIEKETSKCIGENSILYVNEGCHVCALQKQLFKKNLKYLNVIDCSKQPEKCGNILAVPTWEINKTTYRGFKSPEELKLLTGCL